MTRPCSESPAGASSAALQLSASNAGRRIFARETRKESHLHLDEIFFWQNISLVRVLKRMFVVRKDGRPQRGGEDSCLLREASS